MKSTPLKIAIIVGTTRPGRKAQAVDEWAYDIARKRTDAAFSLLDLATFELPLLDEPLPATARWC
jgi:NAD(P)H-dependent FMN reductase